jgi:2-dehydro-3-deoxyphosphogluconate aldolase/(4S)-4-hydroxy-2-oxoglutarate aldolase
MGLVEDLKKQRIVAIVRATEYSTALKIAEAFVEGGLRLIEVAFSFHGAEKLVRELRSRDNLIVGAGTVLDIGMAETAISSDTLLCKINRHTCYTWSSYLY